jgi:hypothetical protein
MRERERQKERERLLKDSVEKKYNLASHKNVTQKGKKDYLVYHHLYKVNDL